jgi:AcrR family transcriptional regulator
MPKPLSEQERAYIRKKLMEEAKLCLARYGVKKTTVDELVGRANISKGMFYHFFPSKEQLFFEVILALHDEIQGKVVSQVREKAVRMDAEGLTEVLYRLYTMDLEEGAFLIRMITNGEMEMLIRKLGLEMARQHTAADERLMEEIISLFPGIKPNAVRVYGAALRGIFLFIPHKEVIGEEVFDDALKTALKGIVLQMFGGDSYDSSKRP